MYKILRPLLDAVDGVSDIREVNTYNYSGETATIKATLPDGRVLRVDATVEKGKEADHE